MRERARIIDRLRQRLVGIGIMAIADDQREARPFPDELGPDGLGHLPGRNRGLGSIQRTQAQRGMGADRQRHRASQGGGDADRSTGDAKLPQIHHGPSLVAAQGRAGCSHPGFSGSGVTRL